MDEVVASLESLDRHLAAGSTLQEESCVWATTEEVAGWARALQDGDAAGVLLTGRARSRLRLLPGRLTSTGAWLAYCAMASAAPEDRVQMLQLLKAWVDVGGELTS